MSLIDYQSCPVGFGQGSEVGQRGDVAAHAEERLGHDELPASCGGEPD
jgi:hypothetical protein